MSPFRYRPKWSRVVLTCGAFLLSGVAVAKDRSTLCDQTLKHVLSRALNAPSGSDFVRHVARLSESQRETEIEAALLAGDLPRFLTRFVAVNLDGPGPNGKPLRITICVAPDYLAIGTDQDYLLVPMRLATALRVADRYGAMLPTSRIVDAVYDQADVRLSPQPLPPTDEMRSTAYYAEHNALVREQREARDAQLGALIAGDKKDLVITDRLRRMSDRVAIYGWHRGSHEPIQPLSTVHGARYADYSHGVRLIGAEAFVDGERRPLIALLSDPVTAPIINAEGAISRVADLLDKLAIPPAETSSPRF